QRIVALLRRQPHRRLPQALEARKLAGLVAPGARYPARHLGLQCVGQLELADIGQALRKERRGPELLCIAEPDQLHLAVHHGTRGRIARAEIDSDPHVQRPAGSVATAIVPVPRRHSERRHDCFPALYACSAAAGNDMHQEPSKPNAPSCDRNRDPILAVLRERFAGHRRVLEIGSGTGQHAVHFGAAMPWLDWQCSEFADKLAGIRLWLDEAALPNTPAPIALDVARGPWPAGGRFDAVFTSNTLH